MTDLSTNTTALGLLPKEAQEEIKRRFHEAEIYSHGGWITPQADAPLSHFVYRLPKRERFVNWDVLVDEIVAVAMDANGTIWGHTEIPTPEKSGRFVTSGYAVSIFTTIHPKHLYLGEKEDWKNSLMIRPKEKND